MPDSFCNLFGAKITWLYHAGFLLEANGKTVFIDPFKIPQNSPQGDLILVTHEHFDHCDPTVISQIVGPETRIVAPESAAKKLHMFHDKLAVIREGDAPSQRGFYLKTVPAYNPAKSFHPRGLGVGYVITVDGKNFYHAGDTDYTAEMTKLKGIDVAMLPIGGTYTMNIDGAAAAANAFKPKTLIPMHYNSLDGLQADPQALAAKLEQEIRLVILDPAFKV